MKIRSDLGILSSDVLTGNLLWVDQVNGNDSLAVRGRMTVPFKRLTAAKNAAVSGDTIVVLPGTYNENNLLKDGVNWHFLNGANLNYHLTEPGAIFDTGPDGTDAAVHSLITGYGDFFANSEGVVNSVAGGSDLHIEANTMFSELEATVRSAAGSGSLRVEVKKEIRNGTADCVAVEGADPGEVSVYANSLYTSSGHCVRVSGGSV